MLLSTLRNFCILLLASCSYGYAQDISRLKSNINILSSIQLPIKMGNKDTLLYLNSVSMNISLKDTIFIEKYGYISGKQRISFFSNNSGIIVRKTLISKDSLIIPSDNISIAQNAMSLMDFPDIEDMPEKSFSDFLINDVKKFDQKVQALIKDKFDIGCQTHVKGEKLVKVTAYTDLQIDEPNLNGQICLFVSLPYKINNQLFCHISFIAREKRLLSANWREPGTKVNEAAKKFLRDFFKQL